MTVRGTMGNDAILAATVPPSMDRFLRCRRGLGNAGFRETDRGVVLWPPQPAAGLVDGTMHGDPAQPMDHMFFRCKRGQLVVQLEEHILRHLLGQRRVANDAAGNAEHHRLVLTQEQAKAFMRSLQVATRGPATVPEFDCDLHSVLRMGEKRVCSFFGDSEYHLRCPARNFAIARFASMDSGSSGLYQKACGSPSKTIRRASTPARRKARWRSVVPLSSRSRPLVTNSVGGMPFRSA